MNEEIESDISFEFPTLVADGIYPHFLEGYASLIFYQMRSKPDVKNNDMVIPRKKEYIADIRMSIPAIRRVVKDLDSGLKNYPLLSMLGGDINYVGGSHDDTEDKTETYHNEKITSDERTFIEVQAVFEKISDLPKEGKKEAFDLLHKIIYEHFDEFREIIREYEQKPNEEKQESQ